MSHTTDAAGEENRPQVRRVTVIGTGLIGTSVALSLRARGVEVTLSDPDPSSLRMACDLGAGRPLADDPEGRPADVAVIAVPPFAVPEVLRDAQDRGLAHVYTDAASVKASVVAGAERRGCDMATFVPGHPMGGREKNGPGAARADLFLGRSWALCPTGKADAETVAAVAELARLCGADPLVLDAGTHDRAVALVSHVPHVASAAVAARLLTGDDTALTLAGQGLRDVTRIAGGDSAMWTEILTHNAAPVADVLRSLADDLNTTADALHAFGAVSDEKNGGGDNGAAERADNSTGTLAPVGDLLDRGRSGHARIPGKHGFEQRPAYTVIPVVIPDQPGVLGRLFAAAADTDVNIEDVRIEHTPGLPLGVAQLYVLPESVDTLIRGLAADGWSVHPGL